MIDYRQIIDYFYPPDGDNPELRRIYLTHGRQVADLALTINNRRSLGLDPQQVEAAAMLHDLGIFRTSAPGIHCNGTEPYLRHGIIGAAILRHIGAPEEWARVAESHTGTGITKEDIIQQNMDLPLADYCPETLLEKLICYADKFYSKSGTMSLKPLSKVRSSLARHGSDSLARFEELHKMFSIDD